MLRVNVTTFNLPIEKINNNRYRVYVDSDLNLERVAQAVLLIFQHHDLPQVT